MVSNYERYMRSMLIWIFIDPHEDEESVNLAYEWLLEHGGVPTA